MSKRCQKLKVTRRGAFHLLKNFGNLIGPFFHKPVSAGLRFPTAKVSCYGPGNGKVNGKGANGTCNSIRKFPTGKMGQFSSTVGRIERCFPLTSQPKFPEFVTDRKAPLAFETLTA